MGMMPVSKRKFRKGANVRAESGGNLPAVPGQVEGILLSAEAVREMRHSLHELANVLTGVMMSGGLLAQQLGSSPLNHYTTDICECSERCSALVREIRGHMLEACGEAEPPAGESGGGEAGPVQGM